MDSIGSLLYIHTCVSVVPGLTYTAHITSLLEFTRYSTAHFPCAHAQLEIIYIRSYCTHEHVHVLVNVTLLITFFVDFPTSLC